MRSLLFLLAALAIGGCTLSDPGPATTTTTVPTSPTAAPYEPRFDGARALGLVEAQVLRPDGAPRYRVPGTEGNNETAAFIADTLHGLGFEVTWHHFNATYGCEETPMHNVVAQRDGASGRIVMLGAHYDTRPIADKDDEAKDQPILGANDGGSGVAVLLELARVLPATNDTVRFVFFDGEDGGGYKGNGCTDWILGSTAYAATLGDEADRVRAFVLVDMVGDPALRIPYELRSRAEAPGLQDEVYAAAERAGHGDVFVRENGWSIEDDHVPFLDLGIPAVDLIHTGLAHRTPVFPSWHHTHDDDLDAVSAESLAAVGESLEWWLASSG